MKETRVPTRSGSTAADDAGSSPLRCTYAHVNLTGNSRNDGMDECIPGAVEVALGSTSMPPLGSAVGKGRYEDQRSPAGYGVLRWV